MQNLNPLKNLKYDIPSSFVVFLVALPLCLGIALASGAPLFSGLIAGMVGGLIVAPLSGSPLGVSGPAAGLAVIVLSAVNELESYETFLVAVVLAGVFQLILGVLKAGVIGYYFPSSVIKGMLSAIGIIIFLKQLPHALGYDDDPEGDLAFQQLDGHNTFSELSYMLESISPAAILISGLGLVVLLLWEQPFIKTKSWSTLIQGPLIVVLLGMGIQWSLSDSSWALQGNHIVNIPVSEGIGGFIGQFTFPNFSAFTNTSLYPLALTMAVVASLETLLCVEATDKLDPYKRITPTNRELRAQGIGNIVSGLIGGLPITQVIVRSSANIQSGGRTKTAAVLHGAFILLFAYSIPNVLNLIPLSALAAVLLMVGYKLAKPSVFVEVWKQGLPSFIPFAVTVVGIVFTDLLVGIGLGLLVAIIYILWENYQLPYKFELEHYREGEPIRIAFSESVSFLNKASVQHTLNTLPSTSHVILDATATHRMHLDVREIVDEFCINAKTRDIEVELIGFGQTVGETPVKDFEQAMQSGKRNE